MASKLGCFCFKRDPDRHKLQAYGTDFTMYPVVFFRFDEHNFKVIQVMIGVILWSDPKDQTAVIWCEDHGDLAFLSKTENTKQPDPFFDVGDVIEFDIQTTRNMRLATNPNRVHQNWGVSLSDGLRAVTVGHCDMVSDTATVIPFRVDAPRRALSGAVRTHKRHG